MFSKNKKPATATERAHIERVKSVACAVCDRAPPSECHELKQGDWFTSVALCDDCHRGSRNGIHGEKIMWRVKKLDELGALNVTLGRVLHG